MALSFHRLFMIIVSHAPLEGLLMSKVRGLAGFRFLFKVMMAQSGRRVVHPPLLLIRGSGRDMNQKGASLACPKRKP